MAISPFIDRGAVMKEWYAARELVGLGGLPNHATNVTRQAKKENWECRPQEGVKGGGFEYHISSLPPPETQKQLKLRSALAEVEAMWEKQKAKEPDLDLAKRLNEATDIAREKAKKKAEAVLQVLAMLDAKVNLLEALNVVAEQKAVSPGSLKNWYYKVCGNPVHEWQALLISGSGKTEKADKKAFIEQEAWEVFLAALKSLIYEQVIVEQLTQPNSTVGKWQAYKPFNADCLRKFLMK
ncbi:DNA-binding protein [Actinobacillus seminis]|uniref:DNA-binding protein n=1 Tax=Actinobacillus seminis TaxID=722 RepID=UPI003B926F30